MALDEIGKARKFHESFPQYSKTPLAKLDHMAEYLGLGQVYVKDESYRFGLNAFKVLGGSFAIAKYIAQQTGKDVSDLPYSVLTSEALREEFGQATFFTATWTRCCMGGQPVRTEGSCLHAEGLHHHPFQ